MRLFFPWRFFWPAPCSERILASIRRNDGVNNAELHTLLCLGENVHRVSLRAVLLACALLGAFSFQAFAQEATIVGTATDPSGAAVPNVSITITNIQTNQISVFTTNSEGQYLAPGLQIGRYAVRAEIEGFKQAERTDVVLAVGDR